MCHLDVACVPLRYGTHLDRERRYMNIGSVVQLAAGGPSMTVKSVEGSTVKVQWFEGTTLKEGAFSITQLKPVLNEQQILLG